jgi:hypothetical protein
MATIFDPEPATIYDDDPFSRKLYREEKMIRQRIYDDFQNFRSRFCCNGGVLVSATFAAVWNTV